MDKKGPSNNAAMGVCALCTKWKWVYRSSGKCGQCLTRETWTRGANAALKVVIPLMSPSQGYPSEGFTTPAGFGAAEAGMDIPDVRPKVGGTPGTAPPMTASPPTLFEVGGIGAALEAAFYDSEAAAKATSKTNKDANVEEKRLEQVS
jgi:hypothetical protein